MLRFYIATNNPEKDPIYCMLSDKKRALNKCCRYSEAIKEHLLKCIIYENSTGDLDHWINELSDYFDVINNIHVKTRSRKLKSRDYTELVFGDFGDEKRDCYIVLKEFGIANRRSHKYPDFQITDELVDRTFKVSQKIIDSITSMFAKVNDYSVIDFKRVISYCLKAR